MDGVVLQRDVTLTEASILKFLQEQPPAVRISLCTSPAAALALLTFIPPLSKVIILRLLHVEVEVPLSTVKGWFTLSVEQWEEVLGPLGALNLWEHDEASGRVQLQPAFQIALRTALSGGGSPWFEGDLTEDKEPVDEEFLQEFCSNTWDSVLNFIVGLSNTEPDVQNVLVRAGLTEETTEGEISSLGFRFLLQDQHTQLWFYIISYLRYCESSGLELVDAIAFFFKIAFLKVGSCYPCTNLSSTEQAVLQHAVKLGLAYQRNKRSTRFYPTPLANLLVHGKAAQDKDTTNQNFLLVETNFRLFATTTSELHTALLSLFSELKYRTPLMTIGILTRRSVQEVLRRGVKAEHLLHYMQVHASPRMKVQKDSAFPPLPSTVVDQILLWEMEQNRVEAEEAVMFKRFPSVTAFKAVVDYARSTGFLIWENSSELSVLIKPAGEKIIKTFYKSLHVTKEEV